MEEDEATQEVEEEEGGDTEKEEEDEGDDRVGRRKTETREKPVCALGSRCSLTDPKHFSDYAHLINADGAAYTGDKRKRGEEKLERADESAKAKRAKVAASDYDPTQIVPEAFDAVEPTLLVNPEEEDEPATQVIEEEESTQVIVEESEALAEKQETKTRPKLVRQYSSQMHLDAFLDKLKQQREEDRPKEATADDDGATQMIVEDQERTNKEASPADSIGEPESRQEEQQTASEQNVVEQTTTPPLEAPSSDLPDDYVDAWDDEHIKLPCSPQNTYRRLGARSRRLLSRWYLIHTVLSAPIRSSLDLQEAIIAYNCTEDSQYAQYWDFSGLHYFFQQMASKEEYETFFNVTLPYIVRLALRLPELFKEPTPLLAMGEDRTLVLTQEQIACLLANGFLCTFPKQGPKPRKGKKSEYPSFSFHTLFMGAGDRCLPNQAAKLRCVFHYFERVSQKMPDGVVSYERKAAEDEVPWGECEDPLTDLTISESGTIEDVDEECLQIDFANKMVGGGVLGYGCIQEEIRFLINTELIASLLFTARLQDNECLLVTGSERYCKYTGYAKTFRYDGDYQDNTPRDELGRRRTQVVAMDALYFGSYSLGRLAQYRVENIERELNKCYAAFSMPAIPPQTVTPVATGNWGCGAFGGYHDAKAIIQLMAASVARRPIRYFTFGEPGLATALKEVYSFLQGKQVTVAALWQVFCEVSLEITEYLDKDSQEQEEVATPITAPQLFNLLFDRFDNTPSDDTPSDSSGKKDKGKERIKDDMDTGNVEVKKAQATKANNGEDDEVTIEL